MTEQFKKLQEHARQIAERENCLLYDLEITGQGQGRTLRVFIDKKGSESVSVDDCSRVSNGLNLVLDVEDLVPGGPYNLEISSPGLERRLREPWHFKEAIGEKVLVNLNKSIGELSDGANRRDAKSKKLKGILQEATEQQIRIDLSSEEGAEDTLNIPMTVIHKAKLVYEFETNHTKKSKKARKG